MLAVTGTLLPEGHILSKSMYESQKLLRALKMPYEQIHTWPKGCVLFRKEHEHAKFYPKCKSSRYLEVDSDDGQKRQLTIPMKILWYLLFLPRIQRLYMTEESVKQMTWHKDGKWYNPGKMVHPSMLKHGRISMTNIVTKQLRPVMYVSRWQQMGSILME